ncbi:hypothetical protein [Halorussus amylolyticus]|uniref:hypothetical protein n=1 Tax=Halorussus amylolyticus TaxID=1126242 RepID=UPI00138F2D25|nr:hypothetical protein [Halorussus amylolyticus]
MDERFDTTADRALVVVSHRPVVLEETMHARCSNEPDRHETRRDRPTPRGGGATGVVELLADAPSGAPVQRVRNYHLTNREAVPRPADFLTAMEHTGGALCVRWAGPPGDCFVRYADPGWERTEHDRFRGRTRVERVEADRVRSWLRDSRPELVAYGDARGSFDASGQPRARPDPRPNESAATGAPGAADGGMATETVVRVRRPADLCADDALDAADAEAVAAALPTRPDRLAFWLPLALAEESVLVPTAGSDRVFVAEPVPDRDTDRARYVRQGRRGGWIPKTEARVYELAARAPENAAEERRESA